jgi:DNA-binding response OmpR family regulator
MSELEIRVLVVDDDAALCALLHTFFSTRHVAMTAIANANNLNRTVAHENPAIIVLDLMMPGVDGLAALRALRNAGDNTPVIMLTARAEDVDRVIGLELGADDYIGKPFMPQELMARISAVLRRHGAVGAPSNERPVCYRFGRFELDLASRTLTRDGVPQRVTPSETSLLSVLIAHPMETLSRARLLFLWHGAYVDVTERGLDVPIWRLRRLIEDDPSQPKIIQTMRGIGYMFVPPQDSDA